ncbi:hypothetical protein [Halorarius litoreus]|uniref:hypothetical protein n=1 Tax=Halorarius litoreus TaxID=2962676 RepID=UPI0020CC5B95|nr:hypothetical protein [Halorarius litoreus]
MTISIEPIGGEPGISIEDRIEQRRCTVSTTSPVEPRSVSTDRVGYPADEAVAFETREFTLSQANMAYVRDGSGAIRTEIQRFTEHTVDPGEYVLEVSAPVKLYLLVPGPFTVSLDAIRMTVELEAEQEVVVAARSYHERPAATITTTGDPVDLMRAVSYLPSSLKTTSAERSYPTLRGHPPEFALGDELDVPAWLSTPDSGIRIEVPPDLGAVMVVAPLTYYLGAEVVEGPTHRIVTDDGWSHALGGERGFEGEVERVLKQVFFLDCVVRTEGIYDVPLYERRALDTDLDLGSLYEAPPADQLRAYLDVPYDQVEHLVPRWKLVAHVAPTSGSIETLPFLVDDMAVVRTPQRDETTTDETQAAAIDAFTREGFGSETRFGGSDPWSSPPKLVEPERTDSLEQAWVGEDAPVGATKATVEAFRNRLAREEAEGEVNIVVVCNDAEMVDEHHVASEVYGSRDDLPFDVTLYENLTTDRLELVLGSDIDFFHYIGHIEAAGFRCTDGLLDVADVGDVGVDTFFLNACRSYQQGMELIRGGAIGGVVTLDEVINSGAIRVGKAMTRLLNRGFPLRAALTIASDSSIVGTQYIVVGDGNMDIAHGESLTPNLVDLHHVETDRFVFDLDTYYTAHVGVGALYRPYVEGNEEHYLVGNPNMEFELDRETFEEFLDLETVPIRRQGRLHWSDDVDVEEL